MITPSFSPTATERVLPKLALDFTTANLDPRITFTRTTDATHPATYVNSSGYVTAATNNQPRFDYDPITLTCKGLLIEESRLNLLKYSGQIGDAAYYATNPASGGFTVSLNTLETLAPDGTYTATKLVKSSSVTTARIGPSPANNIIGTAQAYTVSVFVKYNGIQWFCIDTTEQTSGTRPYTFFDIQNGVIGTVGSGITAKIENFNNGWYRCSITYTAVVPANYPMCSTNLFRMVAGNGDINNFAGNDVNGVFIWSGQVEAGAFPSSYIPNVGNVTNTRNADVATMTGTNFSDWYNQTQGTVYFEGDYIGLGVNGYDPWELGFNSGFPQDCLGLASYNNGSGLFSGASATTAGVPQAAIFNGQLVANTVFKKVLAYNSTNSQYVLSTNASVIASDVVTLATTAITQVNFGARVSNAIPMSGHIKKIMYWKQALTNSEVCSFSK